MNVERKTLELDDAQLRSSSEMRNVKMNGLKMRKIFQVQPVSVQTMNNVSILYIQIQCI